MKQTEIDPYMLKALVEERDTELQGLTKDMILGYNLALYNMTRYYKNV